MRYPANVGIAAVAAAIALTGCGSDGGDHSADSATAGADGAQVEFGNTINYGSIGTTTDVDCADGKSLNVGGSNNTLTVRGTCTMVSVGGADNTITFDRVENEISVVGINNRITYKAGDPTIENLGNGNEISRS